MFKAHTFNTGNTNNGRTFSTFEEALEVVQRSAMAGDAEFTLWQDQPGKTIVSLAGDPEDAPSGMVEEVCPTGSLTRQQAWPQAPTSTLVRLETQDVPGANGVESTMQFPAMDAFIDLFLAIGEYITTEARVLNTFGRSGRFDFKHKAQER